MVQWCLEDGARGPEHLQSGLPKAGRAAFSWVGPQPGATGPCVCRQLTEGKMMERRKKIALELSELVVYCRPVPFDEDSKGQGPAGLHVFGCPPWGVQEELVVPLCGGVGSQPPSTAWVVGL